METKPHAGSEQTALWNGRAGRAWVDAQELLDRMLEPFEDELVEAVAAARAHHVLDVGCGTGSTTFAISKLLGANGRCVGIDISEPMIAAARARASHTAPASFIRADVQTHAFEPARFDTIVSRFGVMFFDDPALAFANLRRAATQDARLHFIVWRNAAENPFMTTAERAAAPLLPNLPARQPEAPGQFSFANPERVSRILESSGWNRIDIQPFDADCVLPEAELVGYFTRLGPVGLHLQEADERTRAQVIQLVRPAFDAYVHGAEVRFTAACWVVSARAAVPKAATDV